jgi:proteasome accessory factor B
MARRPPDPLGARLLHLLVRGWAERRVVVLTYDPSVNQPGRPTRTARVQPWLIEPSATTHALYLIGFDEARGAQRTFKVERIRQVTLTAEHFEPPAPGTVETLLARAWTIIADQGEVEVVLRFDRGAAARVAEASWHPSQSIEPASDGGLVWRATVSGTIEIRSWILGWGDEVEVLAPESLRLDVAGLLGRAAARYRTG